MNLGDSGLIAVFPLSTTAFGIRADWFQAFSARFERPAFLLMIMFLVVWVGIMILKRFEEADFDKKFWNIPVFLTIVLFWPAFVLGTKELVDAFNTYLIRDVFAIKWVGFGFPSVESVGDAVMLPVEALTRLLPNIAYWLIYAFFMVYFFVYTVLGPLVLARGVLADEMETFLELAKEVLLILLWQTTLVVLVAFLMPDIVSGKPLPAKPETNFYFLSLILGIMIFFVPPLTRKLTTHIESSFVPLGFKRGGAVLGIMMAGRAAGAALGGLGASEGAVRRMARIGESVVRADEFRSRYQHRKGIQDLAEERDELERRLHQDYERSRDSDEQAEERLERQRNLIELTKRAQAEMEEKKR
jgi:hypothetical protein